MACCWESLERPDTNLNSIRSELADSIKEALLGYLWVKKAFSTPNSIGVTTPATLLLDKIVRRARGWQYSDRFLDRDEQLTQLANHQSCTLKSLRAIGVQ